MSNLSTLKQQVEEMQAEIERLETEECKPEIPVGTLCWFWDQNRDNACIDTLRREIDHDCGVPHAYQARSTKWKKARIANDIPGCMIWEKHDGGPCPVGGDTEVLVKYDKDMSGSGWWIDSASTRSWDRIIAYAIINKAEWMD